MPKTGREVETALHASFIFQALAPDELERFIASARQRSFRAGEPIFRMGAPGDSMMLVKTGEVTISYPALDGRAAILAELKPGAVFGEIALIDGGERSADAAASTNCTLVIFDRRDFMAMLKASWPLTEAVLKLVCARLRHSDARMADLAFSDLAARLARTLVSRAKPPPGGGPPRLDDTQGTLAALAGGSRENVNRWLRKWRKEGLIEVTEGRIAILDVEGLLHTIG